MAKSKKELQALLNDPEAKWFFYNLYNKESHKQNGVLNIGGHNQTSGDSSAFGTGQFIGDTRNAILKKYGVDAWSKDLEEQKLASLALLDDNNVLDDYLAGNYAVLNKKNPNGTTSMWEAFAGEDPLTGTTNAEVMFSTKPANWEQDYADLETNAVYDPESSWATIDPKIQKEKAKIFENKYSINNPSTLTNDANKLPITADARKVDTQGVPTEQQASLDDRYSEDISKRPEARTVDPIDEAARLVELEEKYELSKNIITKPSDERKGEIKKAVLKIGWELNEQLLDSDILMFDDDAVIKEFYKRISTELGLDDFNQTDVESLGLARGVIEYVTEIANEELGQTIGGKKGLLERESPIENAFEDTTSTLDINLRRVNIAPLGSSTDALLKQRNEDFYDNGERLEKGGAKRTIEDVARQDERVRKLKSEGLTTKEAIKQLQKEKQYEKDPNKSLNEAAQNLEGLDIQEEEEEEESIESLGLNEAVSKQKKDKQTTLDSDKENRRNRMMKGAEMALTGLKAAAGITSLSKAMQDPDIDIPEISPLLMEAVAKQRQISESGLTSSEKNAAMQGMNDAYAGAMKNVLGASGGQRGLFLANQGTVDAQRIQGLNQLAAQDAALHRQNLQQYNQLAQSVGSMKLQRDMTAEQMKQSAIAQNKQVMSGIGANLLSDSLSDISWYLNPNRDLIEKGQRASYEKFLDLQNQGAKFDDYEYDVTGNNLRKKEKK